MEAKNTSFASHHDSVAKKRKVSEREDNNNNGIQFQDCFLGSKQKIENPVSKESERIRSFRPYSAEDEEEERRLGVSTRLKLYEDPWRIKKIMKESDVSDHLCRLMLPRKPVQDCILTLLGAEEVAKVEARDGLWVGLWDYDTSSAHEMVFKIWKSSNSYVFTGNWVVQFVDRRELKAGDEIGLFWDGRSSRFGFRVLARNPHCCSVQDLPRKLFCVQNPSECTRTEEPVDAEMKELNLFPSKQQIREEGEEESNGVLTTEKETEDGEISTNWLAPPNVKIIKVRGV